MENQKIKKSAGRLSPTPMGDYDDTTTYRRLDWVYYGGTTFICKKNNTLGIKPSDPERWQKIIDEIGDMKIVFTEAGERKLFTSGENLSVIIGKIKKFISDLKTVAFTGKYSDLTGQPQSLKNPQALNIKYNGTTQVNYDGSETKEINITPANIGAPATSAVLTTTEQITANTSTGNIAGALAAKAMMADYNNKINQINSNLVAVNAARWGDAQPNTNIVTQSSIQWNTWGNICFVYIYAYIKLDSIYTAYVLATGLPYAKFGYTPLGVVIDQDTNKHFTIRIRNRTELVIESSVNAPFEGHVRGFVGYCFNL